MTDKGITDEGLTVGAGFLIRALARIIDILFSLMLGFLGGVLAAIVLTVLERTGGTEPGWDERFGGLTFTKVWLGLLGGILYHSFCEGIHGASLGKLICRLRVVRDDGRPSNMRGALIRSFLYLFDSLFFGMVALLRMQESPLKKRLGDDWGGTAVIWTKDLPVGSRRSPLHFIIGFFLGSTCWMLGSMLGVVMHAR